MSEVLILAGDIGHTHEYSGLIHNNTKIVVNPFGYPFEDRETEISNEIHCIS